MTYPDLSRKPLVEAIFEVRWKPTEPAAGVLSETAYGLLLGRLYDALKHEYSFYEPLLQAMAIPEPFATHVVQHRFRKDRAQWPLVQIGPGILTVNDTDGYRWQDFRGRIEGAVKALWGIYPSGRRPALSTLLLRYIDAIPFDFEKDNVCEFLASKLKTEVRLSNALFEGEYATPAPSALDVRFSFLSKSPPGSVHLRFVRGQRNDQPALVWETMVESNDGDVSPDVTSIMEWALSAHELTDRWFFTLIEGDLLEQFR